MSAFTPNSGHSSSRAGAIASAKATCPRVLHPWAIFVADVWLELLFSSTVDRERTHTPDDPDSSYTCHKPLHRPLRHLRLRPNSRIRSIRQPDDCRKTPVGYLQSATKANDADKTSDGGLVARGSLAILLTIRRASSLLSSERNRSKRILI